jgi:hypothetical protein
MIYGLEQVYFKILQHESQLLEQATQFILDHSSDFSVRERVLIHSSVGNIIRSWDPILKLGISLASKKKSFKFYITNCGASQVHEQFLYQWNHYKHLDPSLFVNNQEHFRELKKVCFRFIDDSSIGSLFLDNKFSRVIIWAECYADSEKTTVVAPVGSLMITLLAGIHQIPYLCLVLNDLVDSSRAEARISESIMEDFVSSGEQPVLQTLFEVIPYRC